MSPDTIVTSL